MPVLILWAVPAVIFVGGVGYFLLHAHWSAQTHDGSPSAPCHPSSSLRAVPVGESRQGLFPFWQLGETEERKARLDGLLADHLAGRSDWWLQKRNGPSAIGGSAL